MADSSSASAPAPSSSESPESLALQADDDIESIRNVHCAYACIEKLVLPQRVSDTEEMHPTRSELGALMRLVNEELQRRIDAAGATVQSLRGALQPTAQQPRADRKPKPLSGYGWTANGPVRLARS
ncbi:hypothetical protein VLK31_28950 [Variovorax sp. H27-G14]|uniref:hypothetical protein n=1 Tax=Variovorax sp. H27-G14 TaxID=3111914 RepID=UPI0038FC3010